MSERRLLNDRIDFICKNREFSSSIDFVEATLVGIVVVY